MVDLLADIPCYHPMLVDDSSCDLFWGVVAVQLPRWDYQSQQYRPPPVHTLAYAHEHLMLTCIVKVPNHLIAVGIHWAATQMLLTRTHPATV